jgi:PAS domain S-box-containing protein
VPSPSITEALDSWRAAERRWQATEPNDPASRPAAVDVIAAWLTYQAASEAPDPGSFLLVVDDQQRCVAVGGDVQSVLGYEPEDLVGRTMLDLVPADLAPGTPADWQRFLAEGDREGESRLRRHDGLEVTVQFRARAHHPIPGYHLARSRRVEASTEAALHPAAEAIA